MLVCRLIANHQYAEEDDLMDFEDEQCVAHWAKDTRESNRELAVGYPFTCAVLVLR